jgi:hypothetical protein
MRRQGSERRTEAAKVEEKERDSSAREGKVRAVQLTGSCASLLRSTSSSASSPSRPKAEKGRGEYNEEGRVR